jgi:hypothetical protein
MPSARQTETAILKIKRGRPLRFQKLEQTALGSIIIGLHKAEALA